MNLIKIAVVGLGLSTSLAAAADAADDLGGSIQAQVNGRTVVFPALKTDITAELRGDLASVLVEQTFISPGHQPMHATYLFPLNHDAAVYEMVMQIGEERVRAKIQRRAQARATFQAARDEGRSAALLEQQRPNMFTQDLANLMPGVPIRVSIRYAQTVPRIDGAYELVLPLVVGPRFVPPGSGEPPQPFAKSQQSPESTDGQPDGVARAGEWQLEALPAYPPTHGIDLPAAIDPDRVSIAVRLAGGLPLQSVISDTHAIESSAVDEATWDVALATGHSIDNRDFVLRYALAGRDTDAGLLTHVDERGGFFSLMLEPPAVPADAAILRREMVFLLDCSGSMHGAPMTASKAFMSKALAALRPGDSFRIIRFSDAATEFSSQPLPATPQNIRRGLAYTAALNGSGGTMMKSGIKQALSRPPPDDAVRIVTFLTDGYIGNEHEILGLVHELIDDARIYAFGVGAGVNRYLLDELAIAGRGFARYLDPTREDLDEVAGELAERLDAPVLTDIEIDWGDVPASELHPQRIPDLFAGDSLRIQGRFKGAPESIITVRGTARGRRASIALPFYSTQASAGGDAIALIWARSAVGAMMREIDRPPAQRPAGFKLSDWQDEVAQLGLDFGLVTRWTSFVAVSEQIANSEPQSTDTVPVPLNQVAGVGPRAYGQASGFVGAAGPEPGPIAALALCLMLLGAMRPGMRRSLKKAGGQE